MDPSTVEVIELAIKALQSEMENEDTGKIRSGIQNLTEASMKLGEAIYKASQEEAGEEPRSGEDEPKGVDDDIVDADFEDLDDDQRRAS